MADRVSSSFQQQASRAFGQLVRGINDAQLRALMRAIFYRAGRYQSFCEAPLAQTGPDSAPGAAIRHAIRTGRLTRAVAGSFSALSRDLMLAAALLMGVGATEAFAARGPSRLTPRGQLYPVAVLSALLVHDARCAIDRAKRESLEGLMLQAAWLAGAPGVPAPPAAGDAGAARREAQLLALCIQLDRYAACQGGERFGQAELSSADNRAAREEQLAPRQSLAVRLSGETTTSQTTAAPGAGGARDAGAPRLTLIRSQRKEQDGDTTESRLATG